MWIPKTPKYLLTVIYCLLGFFLAWLVLMVILYGIRTDCPGTAPGVYVHCPESDK